MADYRILLEADTAKAEKDLERVETVADAAAKDRKLSFTVPDIDKLQTGFLSLQEKVENAANNIRKFYDISKMIPGVGDKVQLVEDAFKGTSGAIGQAMDTLERNATVGDILFNSLRKATESADFLVGSLAKIGFAMYGLEKVAGLLQSAFGKFFNETIGRQTALEATLLKTQTTVASMSKVFVGGKEITDPLEKIKALTGAVEKNVDSIRERSLELAGVTSEQVVEVFGIVAGQIGQIGGSLKDAEDLAISFSAALGTFQIPLQMARQEINSMLQGTITSDSYLAKALGITNEDIAKARSSTDGVVGYIKKKLETAVAGQSIAATQLAGVLSNIRELGELIGQKFGKGLLSPLLSGLTAVYTAIGSIKEQLYAIAELAGRAIGNIARIATTDLSKSFTGIAPSGAGLQSFAESAKQVAAEVFTVLGRVADSTIQSTIQVINSIKPAILTTVDSFMTLVKAFSELKVGQLQAVVSALANITTAISPVINTISVFVNAWAKFLDLPIIQYITEVATVLGLLKRMGLDAAMGIAAFAGFIMSTAVPAIARIGVAVGGFIVMLGLMIAALAKAALAIAALAGAFLTPAAAIPALQAGLLQFIGSLKQAGLAAEETGVKLNLLGAGMRGLGASAQAMGMAVLASIGKFALLQIAIAVVIDGIGRFQRLQQEAARRREFAESLAYLKANAADATKGLDTLARKTYDYHKALAEQTLDEYTGKVAKIKAELAELARRHDAGSLATEQYRQKIDPLLKSLGFYEGKVKEIIAALSRLAAEEAAAYANSPTGQIAAEQQKADLAAKRLTLQAQEVANSIKIAQLNGSITENEAQRLLSAQQLRDLTEQIASRQGQLDKVLAIDKEGKNQEAINKIRTELAQLEGKQIDIQINLQKADFDRQVQALQRVTEQRVLAIDNQAASTKNLLTITQAQSQAAIAGYQADIAGLNAKMSLAKTDAARLSITQSIADVQKRIADEEYRAALAAIDVSIQQARIEAQKAELKAAEVRTTVALAAAQGQLTTAHQQALVAAENMARLAQETAQTTEVIARYQRDAALSQREAAYAAADGSVASARAAAAQQAVAQSTAAAAQSSGTFASNMERAAGAASSAVNSLSSMNQGGGSYMGAGLSDWQKAEVQAAYEQAMSRSLTSDPTKLYWEAWSAAQQVSEGFTQANAQLRQRQQLESKQQWLKETGMPLAGMPNQEDINNGVQAIQNLTSQIEELKAAGNISGYINKQLELSKLTSGSMTMAMAATEVNRQTQINVTTGPVMQFDGTNYVTQDDFQKGLSQVSTGMLNQLRRSPSTQQYAGIR